MGISLDELVFDPTDDGANVGAYVRAGTDGALIDSQLIAAKEWLNAASALFDSAGNGITSTAGALDVNIASGADFDIRDLSHTQDSIKIGDGTEFMEVNADGSINVVGDFSSACTSLKSTNATVGNTAAEVLVTPLASRKEVTIQNLGAKDVYFGHDNTVTTSTGTKIPKGASATFAWGDPLDIWMISSDAGQDVRFSECA